MTLDIGRGNPEFVNTGAQDIKRTIDGALGLGTDHFDHFLIGGIKIDPTLILAGCKNAGQSVVGSHFAVGLNKEGHKIRLRTRLTLSCQIHGSVKTGVLALVAEGPDNILNFDFHDHVHPTLKVQAQVQLLVPDFSVGEFLEPEKIKNFLVCNGVEVTTLRGLVAFGISLGFFLNIGCNPGKTELINTNKCKQSGKPPHSSLGFHNK